MKLAEIESNFDAFGGKVSIHASGPGAADTIAQARATIRAIHVALTRFDPESELCRLNADEAVTVPVSRIMLRFLEAVRFAGELSGGLVDSTCLNAVERAGYTSSLASTTGTATDSRIDLPQVEAGRNEAGSWRDVVIDTIACTVTRPAGLRLDAGGLGKGMAADMAAERLCHLDSFAVECLGEVRFGGTDVGPRQIQVAAPEKDSQPVATVDLQEGAVATSGITRRSWVSPDGTSSHHLVDPRTGEPVHSGVLQATALAPTALEAEVRAKRALISGPDRAMELLPDGGVIVLEHQEILIAPPFQSFGTQP